MGVSEKPKLIQQKHISDYKPPPPPASSLYCIVVNSIYYDVFVEKKSRESRPRKG